MPLKCAMYDSGFRRNRSPWEAADQSSRYARRTLYRWRDGGNAEGGYAGDGAEAEVEPEAKEAQFTSNAGTQSPPRSASAKAMRVQVVKKRRQLCRFFAHGSCSRGMNCVWAHGEDELDVAPPSDLSLWKTKPCKHFQDGWCAQGSICPFAHGQAELRHTKAPPPNPDEIQAVQRAGAANAGEGDGAARRRRRRRMRSPRRSPRSWSCSSSRSRTRSRSLPPPWQRRIPARRTPSQRRRSASGGSVSKDATRRRTRRSRSRASSRRPCHSKSISPGDVVARRRAANAANAAVDSALLCQAKSAPALPPRDIAKVDTRAALRRSNRLHRDDGPNGHDGAEPKNDHQAPTPAEPNKAAPAGDAVPAKAASAPAAELHALRVWGCSDVKVAEQVQGVYTAFEDHHARSSFRKQSHGPPAFIYYWDGRDGHELSGWWMGPSLGGQDVWMYHPDCSADGPPEFGWMGPHDGPVDVAMRVTPDSGMLLTEDRADEKSSPQAQPRGKAAVKSRARRKLQQKVVTRQVLARRKRPAAAADPAAGQDAAQAAGGTTALALVQVKPEQNAETAAEQRGNPAETGRWKAVKELEQRLEQVRREGDEQMKLMVHLQRRMDERRKREEETLQQLRTLILTESAGMILSAVKSETGQGSCEEELPRAGACAV